MAEGLREAIRRGIVRELAGKAPFMVPDQFNRVADACADAAMAALRPVEAVGDLEPLILYFPTPEDRAMMVEACKEALPGAVAVGVP